MVQKQVKIIEIGKEKYYNKKALLNLGLTELEISAYFNNQIKKWTDEFGNINHLFKVSDYEEYIKFKNKNKKLFKKVVLV